VIKSPAHAYALGPKGLRCNTIFRSCRGRLLPFRTRYLPRAWGDICPLQKAIQMALRLYIWNIRLCEALYLPLQFAEVAARNAIQIPIGKRFGPSWYINQKFINLLPERMKFELSETLRLEIAKRGADALKQDHIIAGLSFGFWVSLMTSAYDKQLWMHGITSSFPGAAPTDGRQAIHARLDDMRKFRNDVAHHVAIFDRSPQREFQNALRLTEMVCSETHWLSAETSRVSAIINERPKI
jgi:hypothetical protein